ncbi:ABC transporter, partial [Mesotoga sp. B105.6.4]
MASTVAKNKKKLSKRVTAAIITVFLWAFAAFWFAPIFWMLSTSMKSTTLAVIETPPQWIPNNPTLENYKIIFAPSGGLSLIKATLNSVIVAVSTTLATLMLSVPAAYALSRLRFRGRMF